MLALDAEPTDESVRRHVGFAVEGIPQRVGARGDPQGAPCRAAPRARTVFEATDARESLRWVLDGDDLGPAGGLHVWRPVRGRRGLELVDGHGRVVDRVSFDVRGVPRAARAEPAR